MLPKDPERSNKSVILSLTGKLASLLTFVRKLSVNITVIDGLIKKSLSDKAIDIQYYDWDRFVENFLGFVQGR